MTEWREAGAAGGRGVLRLDCGRCFAEPVMTIRTILRNPGYARRIPRPSTWTATRGVPGMPSRHRSLGRAPSLTDHGFRATARGPSGRASNGREAGATRQRISPGRRHVRHGRQAPLQTVARSGCDCGVGCGAVRVGRDELVWVANVRHDTFTLGRRGGHSSRAQLRQRRAGSFAVKDRGGRAFHVKHTASGNPGGDTLERRRP